MTVDELYEKLEQESSEFLEALAGAIRHPQFALNVSRMAGEAQIREGAAPVVVYEFPNGFLTQAISSFQSLQAAGFDPTWGPHTKGVGSASIQLPTAQVSRLREMQKGNPARWGNPPEAAG